MPALMLLRHAKSDWNAEYGTDRERPLNKRGVRSARAVGRFVADHGLVPDLALTSPAVRAADTVRIAASTGEWKTRIVPLSGLYGADPSYVLHVIRQIKDIRQLQDIRQVEYARRLMVVGHEPTMSGFLERMSGSYLRVPTGTLASLILRSTRWTDVGWGTGELELFVRPRLLTKSADKRKE